GGDRDVVDEHRARAAHLDVARALGAGEAQTVAQDVEQQLARLHLEAHGRAVDGGLQDERRGVAHAARSRSARRTSTSTRWRLYSSLPCASASTSTLIAARRATAGRTPPRPPTARPASSASTAAARCGRVATAPTTRRASRTRRPASS